MRSLIFVFFCILSPILARLECGVAFLSGATQGFIEAGMGLFDSVRALPFLFWSVMTHPISSVRTLIRSGVEGVEFVREHSVSEIVEAVDPELKELFFSSHALTGKRKVELWGHVLGKYSIEICATMRISKGSAALFKNLRKANIGMKERD